MNKSTYMNLYVYNLRIELSKYLISVSAKKNLLAELSGHFWNFSRYCFFSFLKMKILYILNGQGDWVPCPFWTYIRWECNLFLWHWKIREDTHKKKVFLSGRTTKVPPYTNGIFWAKKAGFIEKKLVLLSGRRGLASLHP